MVYPRGPKYVAEAEEAAAEAEEAAAEAEEAAAEAEEAAAEAEDSVADDICVIWLLNWWGECHVHHCFNFQF
jgi:hypothetical protein